MRRLVLRMRGYACPPGGNRCSQSPPASPWDGQRLFASLPVCDASRFDFYWESLGARGFMEVKGVALEEEGWSARSPCGF